MSGVITIRRLAVALVMSVAAAAGRLDAQAAATAAEIAGPRVRTPFRAAADRSRSTSDFRAIGVPIESTSSRRPWWALPLAGAVAGTLIGLTIEDGCDEHDCTIAIPPPLLGAVYGGAIGFVIEIAL